MYPHCRGCSAKICIMSSFDLPLQSQPFQLAPYLWSSSLNWLHCAYLFANEVSRMNTVFLMLLHSVRVTWDYYLPCSVMWCLCTKHKMTLVWLPPYHVVFDIHCGAFSITVSPWICVFGIIFFLDTLTSIFPRQILCCDFPAHVSNFSWELCICLSFILFATAAPPKLVSSVDFSPLFQIINVLNRQLLGSCSRVGREKGWWAGMSLVWGERIGREGLTEEGN